MAFSHANYTIGNNHSIKARGLLVTKRWKKTGNLAIKGINKKKYNQGECNSPIKFNKETIVFS